MEAVMNISKWITRLTACTTVAFAAPLYADDGQMVRQDQLSNTYSTQPREKLRAEMDAAEQATVSHGGTDMASSPESPDGARGIAGSRYSQRGRDEAQGGLGESSRMNQDHPSGDPYRPN